MWKDTPDPGKLKNPNSIPYILFLFHLGKGQFLSGLPELWPTSFLFLFHITIIKVF